MAREKELRRSLAVFPIGTVMKLTDLTARQIRYYEDQGLIQPERTAGNRRMYSLNDMDRLLEIKDFLNDGYNIAATTSGLPAANGIIAGSAVAFNISRIADG